MTPFRMIRWARTPLCAATIVVAGCAAAPPPAEEPAAFKAMTREMFATVLRDIEDNFIEKPNLEALTLAALEAAGEIDPSLAFDAEAGGVLRLSVNDVEIAAAPMPKTRDPAGWAGSASDLLDQLRNRNDAFRQADGEEIYDTLFGAMTGLLDRYSRYAGADDARANRESREGFGGIGVTVAEHPEGARVIGVEQDKPAQAAGVHTNDLIVGIDGKQVAGATLRRVIRMLRGPVDKPVVLSLRRDGLPEPIVVTVGRTKIIPDTVFYAPRGDAALIRITAFNDRTALRVAEAVSQAMTQAQERGLERPTGLILDLRGNPGGLLDRAVDVADLFLDDGEVSSTDGRNPRSFQEFSAQPGDISVGLPLAVLVDGATASAAEVLAAALQDRGRAVVIGASTFGKGSVQTVLGLPNDGELILTWARLLAPSGYALQSAGVMPTVCTQATVDIDALIEHVLIEDPATTLHNLALRRRIGPNDAAASEHAATLCPWRPNGYDAGIDEEVAARILADPSLYETAIALSSPPAL
ncbi:MAG: S41 family peptidase [Alphaproteobacteria bacterium]|nr:S41 family peptidase [Alphaproteobacteria bacterium]